MYRNPSPGVFSSSFSSFPRFNLPVFLTLRAALFFCCLIFVVTGCGSGIVASPVGSLQISPGSVDFGAVSIGQSAKQTVALANEGSDAISISNANFSSSAFSLASDEKFPISIPAGKARSVAVGFHRLQRRTMQPSLPLSIRLQSR